LEVSIFGSYTEAKDSVETTVQFNAFPSVLLLYLDSGNKESKILGSILRGTRQCQGQILVSQTSYDGKIPNLFAASSDYDLATPAVAARPQVNSLGLGLRVRVVLALGTS